MNKMFSSGFMLILLVSGFSFPQDFEVPITVTDGTNSRVLTIGIDPNGTNGFDPGLDVLAPPLPPAGAFGALIEGLPFTYFTDIRDSSIAQKTFVMRYQPGGSGAIVLHWNGSGLSALGAFIIVDDITGTQFSLDMTTADSLEIAANPILSNGLRVLVTPAGGAPDIAANPPSIDFGGVTVCSTFTQILAISNDGGGMLTITATELTGADLAEFAIITGGAPFTLAPGDTQLVELALTPISTGAKSAVLRIESNDPDENPFEVSLAGNGAGVENIFGDVNADGLANSTDALVVLSYDAGFPLPQPFLDRIAAGFGDVNSDGLTNSTDALIILSADAGFPIPFPVNQPFCP